MNQTSPRFCPNCGSAVPAGQRFCSNCGSVISPNANSPTVSADGNQIYASGSNIENPPAYGSTVLSPDNQAYQSQAGFPGSSPYTSPPSTSGDPAYLQNATGQSLPPPPPPESLMQSPQPVPYTPPYQSQSSYYSSPTQQSTPVVPDYARVQKRSPLRRVMTLVSILVILALIVGGFLLLRPKSTSNNGNTTSNNPGGQNTAVTGGNSTATGGQSGTATSGAPVSATEQLNLMVTYASVNLTIVSVQQANSFPDDTVDTQPGVVRINFQEYNPTTQAGNFLYSDVARLILPDGSTILAPDSEQNAIGPGASVSRTNWIDFPVTTQVNLSKLVLRLGTPTENQMDIPLSPNANLSKYQPKTVHPNVKLQYAGLTWTVTTATASLSENAQQASTGMRFVVVTLSVDNPSSNDFNAYWGDYIRLKSGGITNSPASGTNFPLSFAAGSAGKTGSLIFLMPQDSTSFTLILLARPNSSPPISQATADFQIQ